MTLASAVTVKKLPESVSLGNARELLREVSPLLTENQPRIVFDFTEVQHLDSAGIEMLLRCMEEAMKRKGDVKLAAISPRVAVILELTRVDRLFEIFENPSDAVESFHRFPVHAFSAAPGMKECGTAD